MTLEFVGKVFKAEKKEYEGKQYFKNVLREIDTGKFVSLNTEEALEVDEWYNIRGDLRVNDFKGKSYLSVYKTEWVNQFHDVPF